MDLILLKTVVVIFALSIGVIMLFNRMRLPAIIGFLITGVLVGPHGLSLLADTADVELIAQLGVVMLMFTIGLEFSINDMYRMKKALFFGGFLQISLTTAAIALIVISTGLSTLSAIVIGFIVALSSTAIVMKLLQERAEVYSPHGQIIIAISIFQDLVAVIMMLLLPTFAGNGDTSTGASLLGLAKGLGIVAAVMVVAHWVMPRILHQVALVRNREIFLLATIVICFGVAWLTSSVGLSLALGAFLAGLLLSDSEYGNQALANMLPFKDVFMSLFFVSIGMLLDITLLFDNIAWVLIAAAAVIAVKLVAGTISTLLLGMPIRVAALVGVALAPMSEFGFILSGVALSTGIIDPHTSGLLLAVSVLTMGIAPLLLALSPRIAATMSALPLPDGTPRNTTNPENLKEHLIIIGMGRNGMDVASAAKNAGINFIIIDMNPQHVRLERSKGENVIFGDATTDAVLERAMIHNAKAVMISITGMVAKCAIIRKIKEMNPNVKIVARTQYATDSDALKKEGVDKIVISENQASIVLSRDVLDLYSIDAKTKSKALKMIEEGHGNTMPPS